MKFKLLFFAFGLSCSFCSFSQEAVFYKVAVEASEDMSEQLPRQFIGNGKRISIVFQDYTKGPAEAVDGFTEWPLTIRDDRANTSCQINEGGNWARDHVYLSHDEDYLLVYEYSGSSSNLVSYDTRECKRFQRRDVSRLNWSLDGNKLYFKPFDLRWFVLPID